MASNAPLIHFETAEAMAHRLADVIALRLALAIAERGRARLALSGGSTPARLYQVLSDRDIDWARVSVALVDERWVPPSDPGSNETFIKQALQQNKAAAVTVIGLWTDHSTPAEGLADARARLSTIGLPFDAVVLGMGPDGHTASWFPHAHGLDAALQTNGPPLAAVEAKRSPVTGDYLQRITLTLGVIQNAGFIGLLITGAEKRAQYEEACKAGSIEDRPVRAILTARPDLWSCWTA